MSESEKLEHNVSSKRAESIKNWIKNPNNLALLAVLVLSATLYLFFFLKVGDQPLWWDEAEYMATSKHWASDVPYDLNPQRPPLFQLLGSLLLMLGFSEYMLKFLLVIVPAVALSLVIYFLGKELFNRRIGFLAAIASAATWTYLFWAQRYQPDYFSMCFQLLAFLCFWKLLKAPSNKLAILTGFFAALSLYFKISSLLIPLIIAIFGIWAHGLQSFKKKEYWLILLAYVITLLPLFIWQYAVFGNPLAFAPSYADSGAREERAYGWQALTYFYAFPHMLFFVLMLLGVAITIVKLFLSVDLMYKNKSLRLNAPLFSLVVLVVTAAFYIFYIQGVIEDRWLFLIVPFLYYFAFYGIDIILSKYAKIPKSAHLAILLAFLLALFFFQLPHASTLIMGKMTSYDGIKNSGIWLKQNTLASDKVLSISYTQTTSYAEREVISYSWVHNATRFKQLLDEEKPEYWLISLWEPHPSWAINQMQLQDGATALILPYTNSSLVFSGNQLVAADLKQQVVVDGDTFALVYPQNNFEGVFIYKITYP